MGSTIVQLLISSLSQDKRDTCTFLKVLDNEGKNIVHQIACNFIGSAKVAGTVLLARFLVTGLIEHLVTP